MQQPGRVFGNGIYSAPPPMLPPQGHVPIATIPMLPQIVVSNKPQSSANDRLAKYKRDPGTHCISMVSFNQPPGSPPTAAMDRNQSGGTDGRTCTTAPTLPVKSSHQAYISHVEDGPFHFIVQLKSSVEELLPKLRNILVRQPKSPVTTQLIPGSVVLAIGTDDCLRRGVIMSVQPEACKVYYIDYGNSEELPYSSIYQLPNVASELSPAMALQFCMADLKSVKITDSNKDYFARLLLGKLVHIRITERESNSAFQYCEIFLDNRNVRDILVNMNSPMQYSYQYPPRGREVPISVIYVDGPSQFFVQYRSELATVTEIQEALASYCPSQPRVTDINTISIGSPVASLYPEDQQWYRALVMGMDAKAIYVLYVDYGNRAEVTLDHLCLLSRDLVNKWKTQAVECCLIGFDTVTPDIFMAQKMETEVLGRSYTLHLHSILGGFRLNVDLVNDKGESIASQMKETLNERQKNMYQQSVIPPEKVKSPVEEDDRTSQTSGDSVKRNSFQRPSTRGERPPLRSDRNKSDNRRFDERSPHYFQHDDRSSSDNQQLEPRGGNWNRGSRKPHVDAENNEEGHFKSSNKRVETWNDRPNFKRDDKRNDDMSQGDGQRKENERRGNNRFERKPPPSMPSNQFGGGRERDSKWGNDRDGNKFRGDRDNNRRDDKFGSRENKFGDRGKKFGDKETPGNREWKEAKGSKFKRDDRAQANGFQQSFHGSAIPSNETSWDDDSSTTSPRLSVVISEYPHQNIEVGKQYKAFLAGTGTIPSDVYMHLEGCDDKLDQIRALIDADQSITSRPMSNPVLAAPVLAKCSEDGLIYRATIKSLSKLFNGQVDVLFVDFGFIVVVPISEIYSISSELMSIPIQAIRVKITDMVKMPSCNLEACKNHFLGELYLKPSLTTSVDLEQVVEGTIFNSQGVSVASLVANDPLCSLPPGEVILQNYSTQMDEEKQNFPTSKPTLTPFIERLDLLVGQYLRAKIVKNLDDHRKYVKITSTLDLIVQTKCDAPLLTELNPGSDIVLFVESVGENWLMVKYFDVTGQSLTGDEVISSILPMAIVQREGLFTINHRKEETLFLLPDESHQIVKMLDLLYENYEGSSAMVESMKLASGALCAAKSKDGHWYRAQVKNVAENTSTVVYVDYGREETLQLDQIRPLNSEFMQPALCVKARLTVSLKDADARWNSLEGDDPLQCKFVSRDVEGGFWYVDLYDQKTKENLALKWLNESLAVEGDSAIPADPKFREPGWDLKKGDIVPIVVAHYDSPDYFWAHRNEHIESIEALFTKLQELPEGGDENESGDIFVAQYDEGWYRAIQIEDRFHFIDYGNSVEVGEKKVLPKDMVLPSKGYAVPVHLCVKPASNEWSPEAVNVFDAFLEKDGMIEAEIMSVKFKIVVDLLYNGERVSKLLIEGNHAVSDKKIEELVDVDRVCEYEVPFGPVECLIPMANSLKDFFVYENSKSHLLEELSSLLTDADSFVDCAKPSVGCYVVAKFIDDSLWYRAQIVSENPLEVLFIDYGNISEATEFKIMPYNVASFPLLAWHCTADNKPFTDEEFTALVDSEKTFIVTFKSKQDDVHLVELSAADSPLPTEPKSASNKKSPTFPIPPKVDKQFYKNCFLTHANGPYDFYVQTDDDHIRIEEMSNALFEGGAFPKLSSTVVGDFVVAQDPEDDAYYRAVVTEVDPEVVVHFVDYGNSSPVVNIYELPSKLKEVPALALRCSLQSPIGGWSVDAIDKFSNRLNVDTKSFNLKILTVADPIVVDVEINGSSLTSLLAPNAKFESLSDNESSKIGCFRKNLVDTKLPSSGFCYIVYVDGDDVYVQDSRSNDDVELIAQQLSSVKISDKNAIKSEKIRIGDLVASDFEGSLYRGAISKLNPLEIYFIDYGNFANVDKVYELPEEGKKIKPLAIKVKLDFGEGVKLSKDGFDELQVIAAEGADYILTGPSTLEFTIGGTKAAELLKSYLTRLDGKEEKGDSNTEMEGKVDNSTTKAELKGSEDATTEIEVTPESEQASTIEPTLTQQEEPKSNDDLVSDETKVVTPSPKIDQADQPQSTIELAPSAVENDSISQPANAVPDSHESESFSVTISFVNSPSDFYYQVDSSRVEEVVTQLLSAEDTLSPISTCEVGQLICAKNDEDCHWYRAKVIESKPTIKVHFVDYGNTSEVKEMRQLPDDLLKLAPLGFKASLKAQHKSEWSEKELGTFSDIAFGSSSLKCSVIEDKTDVKIVRLIGDDGDVLEKLTRSCGLETVWKESTVNITSQQLIDPIDSKTAVDIPVPISQEALSTDSEVDSPATLENEPEKGDEVMTDAKAYVSPIESVSTTSEMKMSDTEEPSENVIEEPINSSDSLVENVEVIPQLILDYEEPAAKLLEVSDPNPNEDSSASRIDLSKCTEVSINDTATVQVSSIDTEMVPVNSDEQPAKQQQPIKEKPTVSDTKTRRSLPYKTVAEIKASAKSRISTGRSTTSQTKLSSPIPTKKTLPGSKPSEGGSGKKVSNEKERLIPGVVSGNSMLHR